MLSETAIAAMYTVGGAVVGALISAFVQPLWTIAIGQKSKLSASVQICAFDVPQYLRASIDEYSEQRWNSRANIKPKAEAIEKLRKFTSRQGYLRIALKNKSKHVINGIKLHIRDNTDIIVDSKIDGNQLPSTFGKSFNLDELLPNSTVELKLWTDWDYSDITFLRIEEIVNLTAKKIDRVDIRYTFEKFPKSKYFHISKTMVFRSYWTIFIFSLLGQLIFHFLGD